MADYLGPFTAEEQARIASYYAPAPAMSVAPVASVPPMDAGADYFGPPPPPPGPPAVAPVAAPTGPAPLPEPPGTVSSPMASFAPPPEPTPPVPGTPGVNMSGGGPPREPVSMFRGDPQALAPKPPAPAGGRPGNADPFGVKSATKSYLGTFDDERAALGRQATAEGDRSAMRSDANRELARIQEEDAAISRLEHEESARRFDSDLGEMRRQLDDLRAKKIDPDRLMKEDGMQAKAIIGGLLGGLYMGLNKMNSNPFLDDLNKQIERDIRSQEKNLDSQRANVGERMSLLKEQRGIFRDNETAKLQARNLYYEAAKSSIEAEAAKFDQPIIQARADQAMAGIDRQQKEVQKLMAERLQAQAAAAGAASAAARRQALKDEREYNIKLAELGIKEQEVNAKTGETAGKLPERFVATGKDPETGEPTGYLARNAAGAGEAEEARKAREALRAEINNALAIRSGEGTLGRTLNRSNPDDAIKLYTPEWQTKIRQSQARLTAMKNRAAKLGSLDNGTIALLDKEIGNLESRGDESDVRLRGLLGQLDRDEESDKGVAAGQAGTMRIGPDGKQYFVPSGGQNAPNNARNVPRMPVK